ncbi:hypothetical protein OJ996_06630 [Luteolibacter sp. GHJ8]|uniref:Uncharacterized protein n=1 Tax=Luteolibacter rhizosphaerae TaxID=2989719 RepID=A0ABT3G071_9BACT|nr:hypothetical protein [Luteolibacter rhizosphaerae]MCW1913238.1 hypothetical protein [Luteolibacter rhizosphaerae]
MSLWRREASERLPELQRIIASRFVDGPMMLWIELNTEFEKLCGSQPPPIDLLRRIWRYCDWCLQHGGEDVRTAAALGFGEHLIDSPQRAALLPQIMSCADYVSLRNLVEYHHAPTEMDDWLRKLWPRQHGR